MTYLKKDFKGLKVNDIYSTLSGNITIKNINRFSKLPIIIKDRNDILTRTTPKYFESDNVIKLTNRNGANK